MTDTGHIDDANGTDAQPLLDPALAEGWSRLLLFVGMGALSIGVVVDVTAAVYAGLTLITCGFLLNTTGKLVHYHQLSIPTRDRVLLSLSWLLLALTVVGLLATFVYARYGPGEPRFFWSLAVGGVGFALLHMAAQRTYLPASAETEEP